MQLFPRKEGKVNLSERACRQVLKIYISAEKLLPLSPKLYCHQKVANACVMGELWQAAKHHTADFSLHLNHTAGQAKRKSKNKITYRMR